MQGKLFHQPSWAQSSRGSAIEMYSKTHSRDGKATSLILFVGGVHGDEPEGVRLATEFLQWLKTTEESTPDLIQHSWSLIPCLNVDGFSRNERVNGHGVDLNRNFPSRDWSPEHKAPRYYPGPQPASEPEIQALVHWIETSKPNLIVHFHSWKPCIVYTGTGVEEIAKTLAGTTGYPAHEDIGYPTPGSLGQFGWLEHGVPVICIEEQDGIELDKVWPHFGPGLKALMMAADLLGGR
jgi:predicted deacylase